MAKRIHGVDLTLPKPVDAIRQLTKIPVLIIHGGQDKTVPVEHASILAKSSRNSNISLWLVPEAEHTGSYRARPKEYIDKVKEITVTGSTIVDVLKEIIAIVEDLEIRVAGLEVQIAKVLNV